MQTRSVNKYIFFFLISVFNAATVSADNLDAGKKAYLDYDFDSAVKILSLWHKVEMKKLNAI